MNITFKSTINQNGQENIVEFTSAVTIDDYEDFKVFEFKEPSNNIANRIEVADEKVNIYAGTATINLSLGTNLPIEYSTPHGRLYLDSRMLSMDNKDKMNPKFTYTLSNAGKQIGKYEVKLTVK